jgi:hypothetical protein
MPHLPYVQCRRLTHLDDDLFDQPRTCSIEFVRGWSVWGAPEESRDSLIQS